MRNEIMNEMIMRLFLNPAKLYGYDLYIEKDGSMAKEIVFEEKKHERFAPTSSVLTISKREAQILIDDLWNAGLRPTEGSGSAGSLAATQRHLEDMRTITFKKLNIVRDNG